jgi:hypothetical protein
VYNLTYAIKEFLKNLPAKDFFQLFIVTYDKYVHYYDMSSEETRKVIMIDEPYHIKDIEILGKV